MKQIEVNHLTKKYDRLTAVDDIILSAEDRELVAIVGPDGAGKTSLFRSICGLIDFDSGEVRVGSYDLIKSFDKIKPLLGYMPQQFSLYPDLSVEENLRFYAGLFGLNKEEFNNRKERLYEFSGLGQFQNRRAQNLSGGMKQKLALSCNLIHNPEILVLDEPTTGVDPLSRRQFWDILKSLCNDGSTIIVSTPYMDEVALADRAIFMHRGKKLAEGTPDELVAMYEGDLYRLEVEPTAQQMKKFENLKGLSARRFGASIHLYVSGGFEESEIKTSLNQINIDSSRLDKIPAELEDVFIQLMGTEQEPATTHE